MVPLSASEQQRQQYVDNILAVWRCATAEQEQRGRVWYRTAHELAGAITGGDARAGAGVLAALSANKSWAETCRLARQACEGGLTSGHFANALTKAAVIMAGSDPEEVLPMDRKTGHFFRCIAYPGDPEAVVIDRHAHDIAAGEIYGRRDRGLSGQRYELLASAYRQAAQRLGELPSTVQAVTWVVHTDRIAGTGTRPPRT